MARALPPPQCGPGLNPGIKAIRGLSLLLVLPFALRGFCLSTLLLPFPQKPKLPKSNSISNAQICLNELLRTRKCFVGKQITKKNVNLESIEHSPPFKGVLVDFPICFCYSCISLLKWYYVDG